MNWYYLIWVPAVIAWYVLYSYVSKLSNDTKSISPLIFLFLLGSCPIWALLSRYSKNLIFDGMLYDILMSVTFVVTMSLLGSGDSFSTQNWIGAILVVLGFILMKVQVF